MIAKHRDEIAKVEAEGKKAAEKAAAEAPARAKKIDKKVDDLLAKHVTPEQRARGRQLALQAGGMVAFRDDAVAEALMLTDAQKAAAKTAADGLQAEDMKLRAQIGRGPGDSESPLAAQVRGEDGRRATTRKAVAEFVKSLSQEQAKTWAGLVGEPSDKVMILTQTVPYAPQGWSPGIAPALSSLQTRFWAGVARRDGWIPAGTWERELKLSGEKLAALQSDVIAAMSGERLRARRHDVGHPAADGPRARRDGEGDAEARPVAARVRPRRPTPEGPPPARGVRLPAGPVGGRDAAGTPASRTVDRGGVTGSRRRRPQATRPPRHVLTILL